MILNQNNEYAAVLDACVLVPHTLCDALLRLAEEPAFYRPLWSDGILREVGTVLVNTLKLTEQQRDRRLTAMKAAFPEAMVSVPSKLIETFECGIHRDDRHVLAAAVRGQANAIITRNVKHFPWECLNEYAILCQTPDEFLVHQFHLYPGLVFEKIDQQGASIGKTRETIVDWLHRDVPEFATLLKQYLAG